MSSGRYALASGCYYALANERSLTGDSAIRQPARQPGNRHKDHGVRKRHIRHKLSRSEPEPQYSPRLPAWRSML